MPDPSRPPLEFSPAAETNTTKIVLKKSLQCFTPNHHTTSSTLAVPLPSATAQHSTPALSGLLQVPSLSTHSPSHPLRKSDDLPRPHLRPLQGRPPHPPSPSAGAAP